MWIWNGGCRAVPLRKVYSDDSLNLQTGFVGKYFKSFDSEIKTFLCCHSLIGLYLLPDRDCSAASPIHANISMQIFYSIVLAAVTILIHFMCFPNSSIYIQFIDVSKSIKPSQTFINELFSVFPLGLSSTMVITKHNDEMTHYCHCSSSA